ncbi:NAD(+) hydrolase sarm1-like, partial [Anopheles cruzii]|uniref:NAD(+) hydrolase sarm1-like n=1 Tax=Anopheles cruzii TaxID=68878 RepID=UPI0022EC1D1B
SAVSPASGGGGGSCGSLNALPHHPRYHSTLAPLYRKSSSPGRQWPVTGSGQRPSGRFPKGASRTPGLSRPANLRTGDGRRSSAAGVVVSQRPPLPPKIELRSHSYDGLLDDSSRPAVRARPRKPGTSGTALTAEGHELVDGGGAGGAVSSAGDRRVPDVAAEATDTKKSTNRRSRSMDDLFDGEEQPGGGVVPYLDNTQSMETLLAGGADERDSPPPESPGSPPPSLGGGNICLNRRFVRDPDPEPEPEPPEEEPLCEKETITVDSTPRQYEPEDDDGDGQSTHSSLASTSTASGDKESPKKAQKPLMRYVAKKVKSLMKM